MEAKRLLLALLAVIFVVPGCATLRGSQMPVTELGAPTLKALDTALTEYGDLDDAAEKLEYRNRIITLYQSAIDDHYDAFVDELERSDRELGLVLDLVQLGLSGATALAGPNDIADLATVTSIAGGARATIDRRVYFDRTVPALIAAMDAERAIILTEITRKRALPAAQYSLYDAVGDLRRLQRAGRLNLAVTRVTRAAEADRAAQEARLAGIRSACDDVSADAARLNADFRLLVYTNAATRSARLRAAATALQMSVAAGTDPAWSAVATAFDERFCSDEAKRTFIESLRTQFNGG